MVLLINKQDVANELQVAIGYDSKEFDTFIRDAQDLYLKPLLCEDFYYELMQKKDDPDWKKIIDGGDYIYNSKSYSFRGIGSVLSHFTYAEFFRFSNNVSTSHGFVNKTTPHSTPVGDDEKNNMFYKYQEKAYRIFEDFKRFVDRNIDTYQSWNSCHEDCGQTRRNTGFKTKVIK